MEFSGKVVVVTGGASGIGAAICERFGREGARIGILDRDKKKLADIEKRFSALGIEVLGLCCDITDEKSCAKSIAAVLKRFGGIDVLCNNAGVTQRSAFRKTSIEVYRRVMDINFFGALYCTKAALESLIERKGTIVVTSSVAGIAPLLGRTAYSASKHALHGLFESLRTEIKDLGVHVMMLCPGFTKTDLQKSALDADGSVTTHPQSLVGKSATPESVADSVYKGVRKRKRILVLTAVGRLSYFIMKIFPAFYERQMARSLRSELDR